jgi:hypothetical protein
MAQPQGDVLVDLLHKLASSQHVNSPSPAVLKKAMRIIGSSIANDQLGEEV